MKPHKKGPQAKKKTKPHKKAPQAPKRFKPAFIFFYGEVSKEMRKTGKMKATEMSKMASKLWKKLSPEEKNYWKDMARVDISRFEAEKTLYDGPWTVPAGVRAPKDPTAPKRPMSPYLAYANERRGMVQHQNPGLDNSAISKLLSIMWSSASPEVKRPYLEEEAVLREEYKAEMEKWRNKNQDRERAERQRREELALQVVAEARGFATEVPDGERAPKGLAAPNHPIFPYLAYANEPMPVMQQIHPHASGIAASLSSMIGPSPFNDGNHCDGCPDDGFLKNLGLLDEPFQMPQPSSGSCESVRGFLQGSIVPETFQMPQTSGMSDFASGSYDCNMMAWFDNPLLQGVSGTSQMFPTSEDVARGAIPQPDCGGGGAIQDIQIDAAAFEPRPLLSVPTQNGDANSTQGCFAFQEGTFSEQSRQSDEYPWQM